MRATRQIHFPGFGERILQRLNELGETPASFLAKNKYTRASFYHWTTGRTPGFKRLQKLARDLDVSLCWLLLGDAGEREVLERARRNGGRR